MKFAVLIVTALFLAACNKQIQNFVEAGPSQAPRAPASQPVILQTGTIPMQFSHGAGQVTGANNTAHFAFARKNVSVSGANTTARFSFHQNRPQ